MPVSKQPRKAPLAKASQIRRFKEAARELECDESEKAFDKMLRKLAKAEKPAK